MNDIDYSLYLVTNNIGKSEEEFLNIIEEALKGGATVVQIREKDASTLDFYNLALKVKKITEKYNVPLIVNDRIDIALAIKSEGVHIGQDDMPADIARKIIGDDIILGVSASTVEEAKKAEKDGANYIGIGAVFPTKTKDDIETINKKDLKAVIESVNIPSVAIGGITIENSHELLNLGLSGLSVVSAIMEAENPKKASENLLNIFNNK